MTNKLKHAPPVIAGIFRRRGRLLFGILPVVFMLLCLGTPTRVQAQVTATISGTVVDPTGSVIPNAQVTLTNNETRSSIVSQTNGAGLYAFPSLVPGTYDIKATSKGFKTEVVTGIVLNAGDNRTIPNLTLPVGANGETVTVTASSIMIPVDNGQRTDVLTQHDIENLALAGRDTTELLKVLPGAVTASGGLTNTSPMFNDLNVTVDESSIGSGMYLNGSIYRGGTTILEDGAQMIDIGDMASSLTVVDPEMTSQVTVEASNEGADVPFGPVVVSAISRSGSANFHGDAYFDARNNVLNANGWQQKNQTPIVPLGPQHYYYPGGSIGGPVPYTHKHLLFWGGYERWLQNQGNANILKSYVPTPEMMQGDFSTDNPDNMALCPDGFFQGAPPGGYPGGSWCSDLGGTILANGTSTASLPTPASTGTVTIGSTTYNVDGGQKFPAGYLDPGSAALAKIWPKANSNPATTPGGYNYYAPIVNVDNGWIYRFRLDYHLGDKTLIYGSYQQAYSSGLASGNGAHLYWTPGNAIPFPGGGETENNYGKTLAGHIVHTFNATTTNDFMAAWAYGSYPFVEPNPSAAYKSTLGYPYGKVFNTTSLNIPAYNSAGNETFPDFSQASIFENPPGQYGVKKEAPQFGDTLTKVWGRHTVKIGGFTQTTDNWQSSFSYNLDGVMSFYAGQNQDTYYNGSTTSRPNNGVIGSPHNATAQFVAGMLSSYGENNAAPIGDVAEQNTAGFVDDTWKTTSKLTLELGLRVEHVGHWYDRDHIGLAVFEPSLVQSDYFAGAYAPGFRWHAIDPGIPLSGQPNRFAYADPRFGLSYDLFGNGHTVVRGGWGVYRYVTQVNTVANGEAQGTADNVLAFSSSGGQNVQMQSVPHLAYAACPNPNANPPVNPPCPAQGGQIGLSPTDYGQPMTQAWNLTIDQRLPWNTHLEAAYVGNSSSQLVDDGEDTEGSNFTAMGDQNKMPIGALFQPDPKTGVLSTNPENVSENPNLSTTSDTPTGNNYADYHPFGYAYGTNTVQEIQNISYANYHALELSWIKTTGRLGFDLNGTWSKMLGTTMQENPYNINLNYGPTAEDRPLVFNASYMYQSGALHAFNPLLNHLLGNWTISGISTWQKGSYIPAMLGNGVPNFGMGLTYNLSSVIPAGMSQATFTKDTGVGTGLSQKTYFGTDEGSLPILPVLSCNPTSGLATHQLLNGKCFNAPAIGQQGGQNFPYMSFTPYFDNDLALYRTINIHEQQQVQFRLSAFDWLNHSLLTFANGNYYTIGYQADYTSHQISPTFNQASTGQNAFGVMSVRSALPYARVIELDVKYSF